MSRALLSSVVMLDADAPVGSFGLVMCSGHGPMFSGNPAERSAVPMQMQMDTGMQMAMHGMAMASSSDATKPPHSAMGEQSDPNSLCAFSAAFLTAITVAAVFSLLVFLIIIGQSWTSSQIIAFIALSPHRRPRTRAPPVLV